ncbi:hypothetical protein RZS08_64370, partial [Arthrospira platensis SPKY1]|nr:hypothetical protein [Arthrospira platensis SPKY1]
MLTAAGEHGLNGIKFNFAAPEPISVARGFPFVIVEHEERYDGRVIVEYEEPARYGVLREVSSSYRYLQEIVVDVNHLYDIKVTDSAVADLYVTST